MGGVISPLGTAEGFDYVDLVYDCHRSISSLKEALFVLLNYLKDNGASEVVWNWLPQESMAMRIFAEYSQEDDPFKIDELHDVVAIAIDLPPSHDQYIASLSKHTRQNLRTAYNRLSKAELSLASNIFFTKDITSQVIDRLYNGHIGMYEERQVNRYNSSRLRQWLKGKYHYLVSTLKTSVGFISEIRINGNPAAFMEGYVNADNVSVVIPKLAINEQYGHYSPGMILVNETAKHLINAGYKQLDLARGGEQYKLSMGGTIYNTHNIKIKLK